MNHREKRKMQKNLGILKHKNSLPRNVRFARLRENMLEGKKKEEQMKEVVRLQKEGKKDEVDNNKIASIATELMIQKSISYIDALEEAKEVYKREVEANEF